MVPVVEPSDSTSKLQSDRNSMYASVGIALSAKLPIMSDLLGINRKEVRTINENIILFIIAFNLSRSPMAFKM